MGTTLGVRTVQTKTRHVPHVTSHALQYATPLKPSHCCIDPAVSGPLQLGTHQQSFLQKLDLGRNPDHTVAMVFHPVQPFGNLAKPPPTPYPGLACLPRRPPERRDHDVGRKLNASSKSHLCVLDVFMHAHPTFGSRHPTRQQVSPAVIVSKHVRDSVRKLSEEHTTSLQTLCHRLR